MLNAGDRIALVCTARVSSVENIEKIKSHIEAEYGLQVVYSQDCIESLPAAKRAECLLAHLADPEIKMIWSVQGGEGSADLIPFLQQHAEQLHSAKPTLVWGLSDFTAILLYLNQVFNWPVVHGAAALQLIMPGRVDEATHQATKALLLQAKQSVFESLVPLNAASKKTLNCPVAHSLAVI